jgi:hypothetical protein
MLTSAPSDAVCSHCVALPAVNEPVRRRVLLTLAAVIAEGMVYDRQDIFYMPFSGLEHVTRHGPNLAIYGQRDVVFNADRFTVSH